MYYIFLCLSIISLVFGITYIIYRLKNKKILNVSLVLAVFVALSLLLLRVPFAYDTATGEGFVKIVNTISSTIIHTLQSFSLDEEYDALYEIALQGEGFFAKLYFVYMSIINISAPLITYSAVFLFLTSVLGKLTLKFRKKREKYIFSSVSEKTLTMGENLRKKDEECLIIYASFKQDDGFSADYTERIKRMHALTQNESVENLKFSHDKLAKLTYVLDEGELKNFELCSTLVGGGNLDELYRVSILIMSVTDSSNGLLKNLVASRKNKSIKIYPICEENSLIYKLLLDMPLFKRSERDKLSAMIIGDGIVAYEAIKAFVWCGQYAPKNFTLHVLSKDATKIREKLKGECSELFTTNEYNLIFKDTDNEYNLVFKNLDKECTSLENYVNENAKEMNYVLLAKEDDGLNIKLSLKLERIYNTLRLDGATAPVISYLITNDELTKTLGRKLKVENSECILNPFGGYLDRYDINSFFNSDLEDLSLGVHLSYCYVDYTLSEEDKNKFIKCVDEGVDLTSPHLFENKPYSISKGYYYQLIDEYYGKAKRKGKPNADKLQEDEIAKFVKALKDREDCIDAFYSSIYNKNSSAASGVHLIYNLFASGIDVSGEYPTEEELTEYENYVKNVDNKVRLSMLEHYRWNAYMRTAGYRYPTEEELNKYKEKRNRHNDDDLKLHLCLVKWDKPEALLCDDNLKPKKEYFEKYLNKDEEFMRGLYTELDELDIVSLKTTEIRGKVCEHKSSDAIIILNTAKILRETKKKA